MQGYGKDFLGQRQINKDNTNAYPHSLNLHTKYPLLLQL